MTCATSARALLIAVGKLAVTFVAISIVVAQIDFSFFASHRHKLSTATVVALLVVLVAQTSLIAGMRLKLVLAGLKRRRSLRETSQVALSGFFFEQVAFGFVGGDAMRLWLLHQTDVPLRTAVQAIVIDRCLGMFGLFLLALVGLPTLVALLTGHDWQTVVLAGSALMLAGAVLMTGALAYLARRLRHSPFVAEVIALVSAVIRGGGIRRRLLAAFVLATLTHLMNVVLFFLIGRDLGIGLGLAQWFLIVPSALLVSMLPISAGGWGLREASFVVALASFGVRPEEAVLPPIIFGLAVLAVTLPGGVVWLVNRKRRAGRPEPATPAETGGAGDDHAAGSVPVAARPTATAGS
jgi:uncharacterized membrane protein YbhN (UPF0104 family)